MATKWPESNASANQERSTERRRLYWNLLNGKSSRSIWSSSSSSSSSLRESVVVVRSNCFSFRRLQPIMVMTKY